VTGINSPDISVLKVYYPQDKQITVHQSRVKYCPAAFPASFYWYGGRQKGSEQLPEDVDNGTASQHAIDDEPNKSDSVVVKCGSTGTQFSDHSRSPSGHYGLRRQPRPSRKMIELQARD